MDIVAKHPKTSVNQEIKHAICLLQSSRPRLFAFPAEQPKKDSGNIHHNCRNENEHPHIIEGVRGEEFGGNRRDAPRLLRRSLEWDRRK